MDPVTFEAEMQPLAGKVKALLIATVHRLHQALLVIRGDVEAAEPANAHACIMAGIRRSQR